MGLGTHVAQYFNESGTKMRSTLIKLEALIQKWIGIIQKKRRPRDFLRGHRKKDECLVENTRL